MSGVAGVTALRWPSGGRRVVVDPPDETVLAPGGFGWIDVDSEEIGDLECVLRAIGADYTDADALAAALHPSAWTTGLSSSVDRLEATGLQLDWSGQEPAVRPRRVVFVAASRWLLTYRAGGAVTRDELAEGGKRFRGGLAPADAGVFMAIELVHEMLDAVMEIGQRLAESQLALHEALAAGSATSTLWEPLLVVRNGLDEAERAVRPLEPTNAAFARYAAACDDVIADLRQLVERAKGEAETVREELAATLELMVAGQNAEILRRQREEGRRSQRLQTLVTRATAFVLGPTLVATAFGAQPAWWEHCAELRTAVMGAGMAATAAAAWFLLRPDGEE